MVLQAQLVLMGLVVVLEHWEIQVNRVILE